MRTRVNQTYLVRIKQTTKTPDIEVLTRCVDGRPTGVLWTTAHDLRGVVENLWEVAGVLWITKSH